MKKLLLTTAAIAFAASASAQTATNTDTAQGTASATIVAPITITGITGLVFGSFTVDAASATVTTDNSATAGVTFVPGTQGASNATVDVAGEPDESYNIAVDSTVDLTSADPLNGDILTADLFLVGSTVAISASGSNGASTLDASGDDSFEIYGSLPVTDQDIVDSYTGSYNVTVTYQ